MNKQEKNGAITEGNRLPPFIPGLAGRVSALAILAAVLISCAGPDENKAHENVAGTSKMLPEITVYKSPTCGCCDDWVTHLKKEGFLVTAHNKEDMNRIKKSLGVQPHLASCHTATVGKYVIEGHVPASDIKKLLREKPQAAGLAAPGMPRHSPGMQPPGEQPRGYEVLMFDKEGKTRVYTAY